MSTMEGMYLGNTSGLGTTYIAACFIIIAYMLHPIVEKAYHRIRAYRSWRAIEKNERVEVTHLGMVDEVLRGRGKWDSARIVAVLLLVFSVASWALELGMTLIDETDGPVDLLDRPPPIISGDTGGWLVEELQDGVLEHIDDDRGTLENFHETLQWGYATSKYRIWNESRHWPGQIVTARWYDSIPGSKYTLDYNADENGTTILSSLDCNVSSASEVYVGQASSLWGHVTECGEGPKEHNDSGGRPLPTIILNGTDGYVYLIIEEEGSYLTFLYSVWEVRDDTRANGTVAIDHMFHITSKFRLVEAIITGVVQGVDTGGGCVDLMMQYSWRNTFYETGGKSRARPFGEHPGENTKVEMLRDVEPIEKGIFVEHYAVASLFLLVAMSLLGIGWSLSLRSSIEMDVFNRDELIRAVTLHDPSAEGRRPASMRMFVRKDERGHIDVTISEAEDRPHSWCEVWRNWIVRAQDEPRRNASAHASGADEAPPAPRQVRLEGMRLGLARQNFPRGFGPTSVSLTSSPVPSSGSSSSRSPGGAGRVTAEARALARGRMALCDSSRLETSALAKHRGSFAIHVADESPSSAGLATAANRSPHRFSAPWAADLVEDPPTPSPPPTPARGILRADRQGLPPLVRNASLSPTGGTITVYAGNTDKME